MTRLFDLYRELHNNGVLFFNRTLPFSQKDTIAATIECGGTYGIFIDADKLSSRSEEAVTVAHEAGHCMTGSTHQLYSPFEVIQKHENTADKWAIKKLIPKEELYDKILSGCTDIWELAEHFNVTEDFLRKALCFYIHGNLAVDSYI